MSRDILYNSDRLLSINNILGRKQMVSFSYGLFRTLYLYLRAQHLLPCTFRLQYWTFQDIDIPGVPQTDKIVIRFLRRILRIDFFRKQKIYQDLYQQRKNLYQQREWRGFLNLTQKLYKQKSNKQKYPLS